MDSHFEFELLAEQLATQIQTELTHRALAIVAFDGFGCCGKSTLAQALARRIEAVILETDDFHQPRGGVIEPASPLSYRRWDALQSVAAALALGRPARFAPIDWDIHRLGAEIELGPRPVLIMDGIGSHAVVLPAPPFRIFVDGRAENRMHRVANRDGREHADWNEYIAIELAYFERFKPWRVADLFVAGADLSFANSVEGFVRRIESESFVPGARLDLPYAVSRETTP